MHLILLVLDWEGLSLDDAKSLYMEGDKYLLGYGVPKSNEKAFSRYLAAAKLDLPEAANMVLIHDNKPSWV